MTVLRVVYAIVRLSSGILHFTFTKTFALDNDVSSTSKRRRFLFKTFLDVCNKYFIAVFYN